MSDEFWDDVFMSIKYANKVTLRIVDGMYHGSVINYCVVLNKKLNFAQQV